MLNGPDLQDAEAALALVHQGWRHLQLQRPLAAWAHWQRALRLKAGDQAAASAIDHLAHSIELPEAARKPRRLVSPDDAKARRRWDTALRGRDLGDLGAAADVFEELAEREPTDLGAWKNRALCHAWLGDNVAAIYALDYVVHLESPTDPDRAADAWGLAEILRQGGGAEDHADDLSYRFELPWPDGVSLPLEDLEDVREVPTPIDPVQGVPIPPETRIVEWLDRPMPPAQPLPTPLGLPRVLALAILGDGSLRCSGLDRSGIEELEERVNARLGRGVTAQRRSTPLPLALMDAAAATFRMPEGLPAEARRALLAGGIASYFEDHWSRVPRRGLGAGLGDESGPIARSPIDAAALALDGDAVLRAKLGGIIQIREQLAGRPRSIELYAGYDFNRLRSRLGLEPLGAPPPGVDPPLQPREAPP